MGASSHKRKYKRRVVMDSIAGWWLLALLEVLFTMLLPVGLVLAALSTSGRMPGKAGDDIRLHFLAK